MTKPNPSTKSNAALVEWRMFQNRFTALFAATVVLVGAPPLLTAAGLTADPVAARVVFVVLYSVMLLTAVFAISRGRSEQFAAILLAVPAIILQGMDTLLERKGIIIPSHAFAILFLLYSIVRTMSYFFTTQRATANTVFSGLSVYLLLGVVWAIIYSLLEIVSPGSFTSSLPRDEASPIMRFGGEHSLGAINFSFAMMTTLGDGAVTAVSPLVRLFVAVEGIAGQLLLVTLVGRLVGLHIRQPQ